MSSAKETTIIFFVMFLSPLKPKSSTGHKSHTVSDNLILFDRAYNRSRRSVVCERTTLAFFSSIYLP